MTRWWRHNSRTVAYSTLAAAMLVATVAAARSANPEPHVVTVEVVTPSCAEAVDHADQVLADARDLVATAVQSQRLALDAISELRDDGRPSEETLLAAAALNDVDVGPSDLALGVFRELAARCRGAVELTEARR